MFRKHVCAECMCLESRSFATTTRRRCRRCSGLRMSNEIKRRTLTVGEVIIREQRRYCAQHGLPLFLPYDGRCFSCRRDITHHWLPVLLQEFLWISLGTWGCAHSSAAGR